MGTTGSKNEDEIDDNDSTVKDDDGTNIQENDVTSSASTNKVHEKDQDDDRRTNQDVKRKKVKVGKVEKLLVLSSYRQKPGDFENIVWSLKRDSAMLPPSAMNLYESSGFEALKKRVTKIFLRTMDEGDSDVEIAEDIKLIKDMEARSIPSIDTNTQAISHLNRPIKRPVDKEEENDNDEAGPSKIRRIGFIYDNENDKTECYHDNDNEENTGSSNVRKIGFKYDYNDYIANSNYFNGDNNDDFYHDNGE